MFLTPLLFAGLTPFAVAVAIALAARWLGTAPSAAWAWAVAGGFIAGFVALECEKSGPASALHLFTAPMDAADWLPNLVLLALGASLVLLATPSAHRWMAIALAACVTLAATVRLLGNYAAFSRGDWSTPGKIATLALLTATLGLTWFTLARGQGERESNARVPLLVIVAAGVAIVLALSGVVIYGHYAGALAAALTGVALACALLGATGSASAFTTPPLEPANALGDVSGAAGVLAFTLGGLIILGKFFASLSLANAVLLFAALLAAGAAMPPTLRHLPSWQQLAIRAVLCLVPLAAAVASVML